MNRRDDILPNITVGLIGLDDCSRDVPALAQGLRFIPVDNSARLPDVSDPRIYNGTDPYERGKPIKTFCIHCSLGCLIRIKAKVMICVAVS